MIFVVTKMVIISEFVDRFFHFRPQCVLHLGREVGWWGRPQRGWFLFLSSVLICGTHVDETVWWDDIRRCIV